MPNGDRPPSFQFYPRDFMLDTRRLTPDQRGRYITALCESWSSGSYGVATEDEWRDWMEYGPDEWVTHRPVMAQRFKLLDGKWIQARMVAERAKQLSRHQQAKTGASVTNASRWGYVAQRSHSDRTAVAPSFAFASSSALEKIESKHLPASAGEKRKKKAPVKNEAKAEWLESFPDWYESYPRKIGRSKAVKAWLARKPWSQDHLDRIFSGTTKWAKWWSDNEKEKEYIPHPTTFLNQGRYEDEPS